MNEIKIRNFVNKPTVTIVRYEEHPDAYFNNYDLIEMNGQMVSFEKNSAIDLRIISDLIQNLTDDVRPDGWHESISITHIMESEMTKILRRK